MALTTSLAVQFLSPTTHKPVAGAVVKGWLPTRFSKSPSLNTPLPSGSPNYGPVTTNSSGQATLTGITESQLAISFEYLGQISWSIRPVFNDTGKVTLGRTDDINVSGAVDGDQLVFHSSDEKWHNTAAVSIGTALASGPLASRPAVADATLYFQTDGPFLYRSDGTNWSPFGPIFSFATPPTIGAAPSTTQFGWVNQSSASAVTTNGGIYLDAPINAGDDLRMLMMTAPATPYVITAYVMPLFYAGGTRCGGGLCFRFTGAGGSNNRIHAFLQAYSTTAKLISGQFTNATTYFGDYSAVNLSDLGGLFGWMRIADDGTNRICSYSRDGVNFLPFHTVLSNDFLTSGANQVGFCINPNTVNRRTGQMLLSWKQT